MLRYQIASEIYSLTDSPNFYYYETLSSTFWKELYLSRDFHVASLIICLRKTSSISFCLLEWDLSSSPAKSLPLLYWVSFNEHLFRGYHAPGASDEDEEDSSCFKESHSLVLRDLCVNNYKQCKYYNQTCVSLFLASGLLCRQLLDGSLLFACFL